MKTLVISRPIYDNIMHLVDYPKDGDTFYINQTIHSLSNIGSIIAIAHQKYGVEIYFTGMIGEDDIGREVKEILDTHKVDINYIETSYTEKTCIAYKIYNAKSNKFTTIQQSSIENNLAKYKYDFVPDVVIMDDKDYPANLAAINNYKDSKLIFVGEKYTKESSVYCQKCNYIICNLKFASDATGVVNDLHKPQNIINLFQKYIDVYSSNLIIKLDNFDILYCVGDEVRIIKNINQNIMNKDNVYYAILTYFLSLNVDVENSIKLTNKVMLSTSSELDMIKNIPDYDIVKITIDEYNKYIEEMSKQTVQNSNVQPNANVQTSSVVNQLGQNVVNNQAVQGNVNLQDSNVGFQINQNTVNNQVVQENVVGQTSQAVTNVVNQGVGTNMVSSSVPNDMMNLNNVVPNAQNIQQQYVNPVQNNIPQSNVVNTSTINNQQVVNPTNVNQNINGGL